MFISDKNLSLRIAEPEYAEQIYAWENDRTIWRVSGTHSPYSRFQIEQFLMGNSDLTVQKQLRLMIHLEDVKQAIGCVDIVDYDAVNERAEIGILIDNAFRQQGYATTTLKLVLDYLFIDLMLHQAYCFIDEQNDISQHLFLGLGFTVCGRRKQWIKTPNGFIDQLEYQIINPKYGQTQNQ